MMEEQRPKLCERCYREPPSYKDTYISEDTGEKHTKWLCHSCDFDCMNGGDIMDDAYDVSMRHEEEEWEEDPINNPMPSWMPR